ncbi:hypothetical protein ACFLZ7_00930 [Nanoarchaeota archaeon]
MADEVKGDGRIPTLHVSADSIPQAFYRLMKAVHEQGYPIRTQYDRKEHDKFIDPPSKDAAVSVEITNPFKEPRFPVISYSEVGKYIAEFLGVKDHMVVPFEKLKEKAIKRERFEEKNWPYVYHDRLVAYPFFDGQTIDQLDLAIDALASDNITRRAVTGTPVPSIDLYLKGDMPCLRELHFRAPEDQDGNLVLNTRTMWRSRDLYRAWNDNVLGMTNLLQIKIAKKLAEKTGKKVIVGPYSEWNTSLHIYGQCYNQKPNVTQFFEQYPDEDAFVKSCWTSEFARDNLVLPQLKELREQKQWKFPPEAIKQIDQIIGLYESGELKP